MKQKTIDSAGELQPERDEDLISTLMEISVIAKRLANHKTTKTSKTMEDKKDAETLRTNWRGRQHEI